MGKRSEINKKNNGEQVLSVIFLSTVCNKPVFSLISVL